jgi:TolQ protein
MEPLTQAAPAMGAAHDLSFLGLFLQADPIVKGVMIGLVLMSLACWTVILDKAVRIASLRRQARAFAETVVSGGALGALHGRIPRAIAQSAVGAWRDQDPSESRAERRERIERAMRGALSVELKGLERGLPFLATTGSAAPFIGLFGTVWGIMNSFSAIAKSQDTSLAVVAPGIAEALFATAIGLVAAIPAVMAYNKLTTDLSRLAHGYGVSIATLGDRLARDRGGDLRAAAE